MQQVVDQTQVVRMLSKIGHIATTLLLFFLPLGVSHSHIRSRSCRSAYSVPLDCRTVMHFMGIQYPILLSAIGAACMTPACPETLGDVDGLGHRVLRSVFTAIVHRVSNSLVVISTTYISSIVLSRGLPNLPEWHLCGVSRLSVCYKPTLTLDDPLVVLDSLALLTFAIVSWLLFMGIWKLIVSRRSVVVQFN